MPLDFHPFLQPEEYNKIKKLFGRLESSEEHFTESRRTAKIKKSFTFENTSQTLKPQKQKTGHWHRPFDNHNVPKFHQHIAYKTKPKSLHDEIGWMRSVKPKVNTGKKHEASPENPSSEMHAFYFMELLQDIQDELLAEYRVIVPDEIRHDLEKMKNYIENHAFVPLEKILEILDPNKNTLETEFEEN